MADTPGIPMGYPAYAAVHCPHPDAAVTVAFNRFEDTGRFSADIKIKCLACGEPFRFLGLGAGTSPYEPLVSIDGLELRAPIEPQGTPKLSSHARFTLPPLPPKLREGS